MLKNAVTVANVADQSEYLAANIQAAKTRRFLAHCLIRKSERKFFSIRTSRLKSRTIIHVHFERRTSGWPMVDFLAYGQERAVRTHGRSRTHRRDNGTAKREP